MKKVVLRLDIRNDMDKKKAMKTVTRLSGLESISIDMKEKKLTVTGEVDAVAIVGKLRKLYTTDLVSVGPAKEPEKKKEEPNPKKDGPIQKKEETKKEEPNNKKDGPSKKKEPKQAEPKDQVAELVTGYEAQYPPYQYRTRCYCDRSIEEDPNACVIC